MAVFDNKKTIHFGAKGYTDYTMNKDRNTRENYLRRHRVNEDWSSCDTAGSLSKHILWGPTSSKQRNIQLFKDKFKLQ